MKKLLIISAIVAGLFAGWSWDGPDSAKAGPFDGADSAHHNIWRTYKAGLLEPFGLKS